MRTGGCPFCGVVTLFAGLLPALRAAAVGQRCMMITLDPATAKASPEILRCVAQRHDKCAGVYGTVLTSGEVRVGDTVALEA